VVQTNLLPSALRMQTFPPPIGHRVTTGQGSPNQTPLLTNNSKLPIILTPLSIGLVLVCVTWTMSLHPQRIRVNGSITQTLGRPGAPHHQRRCSVLLASQVSFPLLPLRNTYNMCYRIRQDSTGSKFGQYGKINGHQLRSLLPLPRSHCTCNERG
jgi:hypothetical protein